MNHITIDTIYIVFDVRPYYRQSLRNETAPKQVSFRVLGCSKLDQRRQNEHISCFLVSTEEAATNLSFILNPNFLSL